MGKERKKPEHKTCLFCGTISSESRFIQHVATHTMEKSYICTKCPLEFRTPHQLSRHLTTVHSKPLQFCCVFCDQKCFTLKQLEKHIISHTSEKWFECNKCSKSYSRPDELLRHIKKFCIKTTHFSCIFCDNIFQNNQSLFEHLYSHTNEKWFDCKKCFLCFISPEALRAHRNTHFYQCTICRFKFKDISGLRGHMRTVHSQTGRWKCSECPVNCTSKYSYDIHMRKHTGERPFACDKCPRKFTRRNLLRNHMESHDPTNLKDWLCVQCRSQSYSKEQFLRHMNTHSKPLSCDLCNKRFSRKTTLQTHIFSHTGERPYKCNLCPNAYRAQQQLYHHQRSFHGLQQAKHECNLCEKTFHRKCGLRDHLKVHQNQRRHKCIFCKESFLSLRNLNSHLYCHTNEAPFICSTCGDEYKSRSELYEHFKKHPHDGPFVCDKCPNRFPLRSFLRKHMVTHDVEGLLELMCGQCDKQFYSKVDLLNHAKSHKKAYKCKLCNESFSSKPILETHILSHTGERPFKCKSCSKTYRTRASLRYHQNSVHGALPGKYQCKVCTRIFHRRCALRIHLKIHGNDRPIQCLFCERCFITVPAAWGHLRSHINEAPFICMTCGSEYKTSTQLNKHDCESTLGLLVN